MVQAFGNSCYDWQILVYLGKLFIQIILVLRLCNLRPNPIKYIPNLLSLNQDQKKKETRVSFRQNLKFVKYIINCKTPSTWISCHIFCNSDFNKSIYFGKNYLNILKLLPFTKQLINSTFYFLLVLLFKITFVTVLS